LHYSLDGELSFFVLLDPWARELSKPAVDWGHEFGINRGRSLNMDVLEEIRLELVELPKLEADSADSTD
jgi:hypothetical protein